MLQTNLDILAKTYPQLYKLVSNFESQGQGRFSIIETKNGSKTIMVKTEENGIIKQTLMHSKYNPQVEAKKFAEEAMQDQKENNVLFGFGMGYHVDYIAELLKSNNQLVIFDTSVDIFIETLKYRDLTGILLNPQVKLIISDNLKELTSQVSYFFKDKELNNINFITHIPSINAIASQYEDYRSFLLELNLRKSISNEYVDLMKENAVYNVEHIDKNVGELFDKFKGVPIIIVCAGPSLDKNKHLLKDLENKAVIICVGHALKSLNKMGIRPHFIITIDPQEIVFKQIEGLEHLDIPFILLATAAKKNTQRYQGPKLIASQSLDYLNQGQERFLVKTGGSVSTTALDIAIRMGGNPIIYIGQDLSYPNNQHHCEDTFHTDKNIQTLKNMRTVKGQNDEVLYTTLGMLSFKRWIENRIIGEVSIDFINATEGGAYLSGFNHLSLQKTINRYINKQFSIEDVINRVVNNNSN